MEHWKFRVTSILSERDKVCYIDFLLNMSLLKISKSVVRIRKGHFKNSVFVNPGIYSCAVDAFLEISMHLILPYLSNLHIWNEFTDLLFNVCSHYMSLREDSSLLSKIWALFGRKSLTFVVHSQLGIVMPVLTRYLRKEHLVLLMKKRAFSCMILRKFDSYCSSCSNLPGLWIALFF